MAEKFRFEIAPSILAADFARLGEQARTVAQAGVSMLHVDVMDGHFVPNITIGPPVVESLRRATDLTLDCHLMIEQPERYIAQFAEAGARMISVHQEACPHLHRTLQMIRDAGAAAGAALNPATPIGTLSHVWDVLDFVLVMSVNPGFGGQKFLPAAAAKVGELDRLRRERELGFRIEIDGGITGENISRVVRAGCDIVIAGSSVFGTPDPARAVEQLRAAAAQPELIKT